MCEYCADILGGRKELLRIDKRRCNNIVRLFNYYDGSGTVLEVKSRNGSDDIKIKYCPMCGRNLKEEEK